MEKTKERSRQWYQDNLEKAKESSKQWYQDNLEKVKERSKQWRQDNLKKAKEKSKQWRQDNMKKAKVLITRWKQEQIKGLTDFYISQLLKNQFQGLTNKEIKQNPELIELKRMEIENKRKHSQGY